MLAEHEILTEGEQITGRYQAEIARWSNDQWISTVPALFMLVTNQRIILQPQTRKHYTPASIPGRFIRSVGYLKTHRRGFTLTLKNDQQIHLFVNWNNQHNLMDDIRAIAALPPERTYHLPLTMSHLQKLIVFVETLS